LKKCKHVVALLLAVAVSISLMGTAFAEETRTQNADIVLVMDDTGSMTWNDPNELAKVAIEQAGIKAPFEKSNIGVVTFSTEVIRTLPMTTMNAQTHKEFKAFAETALTRKGMYTDLAVGLAEAVRMLNNLGDSDNVQAIIAVTDGANDFGYGRTAEDSARDLAEVERIAQEKGIQIHLVAINSEEATVSAYLNGIASVTNGSAEFVDSTEEVLDVITRIYADLGLNDGGLNEGDRVIHVENTATVTETIPEDVFEVLFTVKHENPITLTIVGPDGKEIYPANLEGNVFDSISDVETVVKILEPAAGEYTLTIQNVGSAVQDVLLSVHKNHELQVAVNCPGEVKRGEAFTIQAMLMRENQQYMGVDLQNLTAVARLSKNGSTKEVNLPLDGDKFSGEVQLEEAGDWSVVVEIRSNKNFSRTNDQAVTVSVVEDSGAAVGGNEGGGKWLILLIIAVALIILIIVVRKVRSSQIPLPRCTLDVRCSRGGRTMWSILVSPGHALKNKKQVTLLMILQEENRLGHNRIHLEKVDEELFSKVKFSANRTQEPVSFVWTVEGEHPSRTVLKAGSYVRVDLRDEGNTSIIVEWRGF